MKNQLSRLLDTLSGLIWTVVPDRHIDFVSCGQVVMKAILSWYILSSKHQAINPELARF